MEDSPYPTIDLEVFLEFIRNSPKVDLESEESIGNTFAFLLKGDKPIYKRQLIFRAYDGQVHFLDATNKAILLGFLSKLLDWYESNRSWKDGAYFIP